MTDLIRQIAIDFHFLRPAMLWTILPLAILALLFFLKKNREDSWKKKIPAHLAEHLINPGKGNSQLPGIMMFMLLLIAIFAASGPAWHEVDRGEVTAKSALVIALDLSRSMLATDLQPNRLERAKLKIIDLLNERPGMPVALVGFAGTSHTIIHFTGAYNTVKYLLENVSPSVMPVKGTNYGSLFTLADSLLQPTGLPGNIMILTDRLPEEEFIRVKDISDNSLYRVEFLLIATPGGAPIPIRKNAFLKDDRGKTVVPRLNTAAIKSFSELRNIKITLLTLDKSDIEKIIASVKKGMEFDKKREEENREWEDYGFWFMIPAILLLLFWFQKGWVVTWVFLVFLNPWTACETINNEEAADSNFAFIDLWLSGDQQGQRLFDEGLYLQAATKFEDPYWQGTAYYKAKRFQRAAQLFYQIKTPHGYFNLGMSMAELENWDEAVFAFSEALKLNPGFSEAEDNLRLIKKLIPVKKEIKLMTPQSLEDKIFGKSEELDQQSDEKGDEEETAGRDKQPADNQIDQPVRQGDEQFTLPDGSQQQKQEKDILLKQMSDDPAVFLKRKFAMQLRKQNQKIEWPREKW